MHLFLLLILHLPAAAGQIDPGTPPLQQGLTNVSWFWALKPFPLWVPEHCRYALGMEDERVQDQDLTASSQWYETTGPQNARSASSPPLVSSSGASSGRNEGTVPKFWSQFFSFPEPKDSPLSSRLRWTRLCFCRLNREKGDGAWCPKGQLEPSDSQYLQVSVCAEL